MDVITLSLIVGGITALALIVVILVIKLGSNKKDDNDKK